MTLDEALARIIELEKALEGAVWVTADEVSRIRGRWNLSPSEARLVLLLYRARVPLGRLTLDDMIPSHVKPANRIDPDFRSLNTVSVWVNRTRKHMGDGVILGKGWTGYWLTDLGRLLVEQTL